MGRRRNDPELVQELIDGRWTMTSDEFDSKFYSLSSSDRDIVSAAIDNMEAEFFDDDDDDESISVYDAAQIWASHGKDEDYTFGYSEHELNRALKF
jgi:hypothetical protein